MRLALLDRGEHLLGAGDDEIAAEHEIGLARGDANGVDVGWRVADLNMAVNGAALLREAGHVDDADALALKMRRHAENGGHRDDARAAQSRDDHAVRGAADLRELRLRKRRLAARVFFRRQRRLLHPRAMHGHEARAKALDTGEVLVAGRLVDAPLAAEFGLDRLHGDAIRGRAAITTALAHQFVDDDARVGIRKKAALAQPALLGRAGLVIDEDGDALGLGQLALHLVQHIAMMDGEARRPGDRRRIFGRLVGDKGDFLHALGRHLIHDGFDGEFALVLLAAGHGDDAVVENFEGDVGAGGDREADGERARVVVGAVAEILEDVLARGEGRLANPVGALAAHMGVALGAAVHPLRHVMAADARIGARALRHMGRGRVRTAGAKMRHAHGDVRHRLAPLLQPLQTAHTRLEILRRMIAQHATPDGDGDVVGVERALNRKEPVAALVLLADADGLMRRAVQLLAQLHFDERTLLLDHHDEIETARELLHAFRLQRPGRGDLIEADAEIIRPHFVDAEIVERLTHVEIGFADGDDADLRRGAA